MAFVLMVTYGTFGDVLHLLMWAIIGITSLFLKIFWVAMIVMVIVSWVAPTATTLRGAGLPDQRAGAGAVPSPGAEPGRHGHLADLRLHRHPGDPVVPHAPGLAYAGMPQELWRMI
jgi:YggT family protein